MKIGPDEGNSGAIIRWGKHLDNGLWLRIWKHKKLWFKWRLMKGYLDFGFFVFRWGN